MKLLIAIEGEWCSKHDRGRSMQLGAYVLLGFLKDTPPGHFFLKRAFLKAACSSMHHFNGI